MSDRTRPQHLVELQVPDLSFTGLGEQERLRSDIGNSEHVIRLGPDAVAFLRYADGGAIARARELVIPTMNGLARQNVASGPAYDLWRELPGSLEGETHHRRRRALAPAFTTTRCDPLSPGLSDVASSLVQSILAASGGDLVAAYAIPLTATAIARFIGLSAGYEGRIVQWATALSALFIDLSRDELDAATHAAIELGRTVDELLDRRAGNTTDDFISFLARMPDSLTRSAQRAAVANVIFGGLDTTAKALGNGLFRLLCAPAIASRLGRDPSLVPMAVEEMLRLEPPVAGVTRFAVKPFCHDGIEFAPGDTILVMGLVANRDPVVFENPDVFRLEERPRHLTFGAGGPHHCLGAELARLIMTVGVRAILPVLSSLRLTQRPCDVVWHEGTAFRGVAALPTELVGDDVDADVVDG